MSDFYTNLFINNSNYSIHNFKFEEEYAFYHKNEFLKYSLCVGVIMLIVDLSFSIGGLLDDEFYLLFTIIDFIVLFTDIISLIIIMKSQLGSKLNKLANYSKSLFIFRIFIHLVGESIFNMNDICLRKGDFQKLFYQQLIISGGIYITFFNPHLIFGIFIFIGYLGSSIYASISTPENKFEFIFEIIASFAIGVVQIFKVIQYNSNLRSFNEWKKNQQSNDYFRSLIDNLNYQVFSIKDNVPVYYNKEFLSNIRIHSENENDNTILKTKLSYYDDIVNIETINSYTKSILMLTNDKSIKTFYQCINELLCNNDRNDITSNMPNNKFITIGTFTNNEGNRYFNICVRKYYLSNKDNDYLLDFLIHEFTTIRQAEIYSSETKIKQKLFSKLAHEFKTPILVIKSLSQELIDNETERNNLCSQICSLSDYVTFLISDIIYYTSDKNIKIESDEMVDIRDIMLFCKKVCDALIKLIPNKLNNVISILKIDDLIEKYKIYSNSSRLKQVIINFVSNAVKFTRKGTIYLTAYIEECKDENKKTLNISIKDTGIGMNDEYLKLMLNENNIELEINKNYNEMGSGLGVNISKNILSELDHTLIITSEENKGTECIIKIKLELKAKKRISTTSLADMTILYDKEFTTPKIQTKMSSLKSLEVNITNITDIILIVEDNQSIRKSIANVLKLYLNKNSLKKRFDIIECADGIDMLKIVKDDNQQCLNKIKLIITDENMEYMCGSNAISILKSLEMNKKINTLFIISLTAFSDEFTVNEIISRGANMIVDKPLSNSKADHIMNEYLKFENKNSNNN